MIALSVLDSVNMTEVVSILYAIVESPSYFSFSLGEVVVNNVVLFSVLVDFSLSFSAFMSFLISEASSIFLSVTVSVPSSGSRISFSILGCRFKIFAIESNLR